VLPNEDPSEKRERHLAFRNRQAERDRLGDTVDDEPGGDRLAARHVARSGGHRHRAPRAAA
jgi:hypothetical protein